MKDEQPITRIRRLEQDVDDLFGKMDEQHDEAMDAIARNTRTNKFLTTSIVVGMLSLIGMLVILYIGGLK